MRGHGSSTGVGINYAEDGTLLSVGEDERHNFSQTKPSPKKN